MGPPPEMSLFSNTVVDQLWVFGPTQAACPCQLLRSSKRHQTELKLPVRLPIDHLSSILKAFFFLFLGLPLLASLFQPTFQPVSIKLHIA